MHSRSAYRPGRQLRLDIRRKNLPKIEAKHRSSFRTKLEFAVALVQRATTWLKPWENRLRQDAARCAVTGPRPAGRRLIPGRVEDTKKCSLTAANQAQIRLGLLPGCDGGSQLWNQPFEYRSARRG